MVGWLLGCPHQDSCTRKWEILDCFLEVFRLVNAADVRRMGHDGIGLPAPKLCSQFHDGSTLAQRFPGPPVITSFLIQRYVTPCPSTGSSPCSQSFFVGTTWGFSTQQFGRRLLQSLTKGNGKGKKGAEEQEARKVTKLSTSLISTYIYQQRVKLTTTRHTTKTNRMNSWLVVWNISYFPIYWEWSSQLTNIFQRGSNHQPVFVEGSYIASLMGRMVLTLCILLWFPPAWILWGSRSTAQPGRIAGHFAWELSCDVFTRILIYYIYICICIYIYIFT